MYMIGFKCRVVGATSELPLGVARPPVWCEDDRSKCVVGAKQMIYWHQAERNNIEVEGKDLSGNRRSPGYNQKLGFKDGALTLRLTAKHILTLVSHSRCAK
jgi:hypothetical protein